MILTLNVTHTVGGLFVAGVFSLFLQPETSWVLLLCAFLGAFLGSVVVNCEQRGLGMALSLPWSRFLIQPYWSDYGLRGPTHSIFVAPFLTLGLSLWTFSIFLILLWALAPLIGGFLLWLASLIPIVSQATAQVFLASAWHAWISTPLVAMLGVFCAAVLASCFLHLALDYITPGGGHWLWPRRNGRMISLPFAKRASSREWYVLIGLLLISVVLFLGWIMHIIYEVARFIWHRTGGALAENMLL